MATQAELLQQTDEYIVPNYGSRLLAIDKASGSRFWDADGKEYIDFFPGFGAGGVTGHCHPAIVDAVQKQSARCMAHGNFFTNEAQVDLARRITQNAFGGKVFFCHSGAEANETAIKLVRLAAGEKRYKIISFHNCFHGRTLGGLSLTPRSFQKGFDPMLPGNAKANFGDIESVKKLIDDETAGIFVEPIQAEGGVNIPTVEFMQSLRKLCDENDLLLVCDEVWTGPARTGKMFAHQHFGIEPDLMTLGKAIGGGLPVGAMVASPKYADVLGPGTHGCTMGGMPVCAAAGAATMKLIEDENLLDRAIELGEFALNKLRDADLPQVKELRGKGLLIGMQMDESVDTKQVMLDCMEKGLIICVAKNNVLRVAPALVIDQDELGEGLDILIDVLK